MSRNLNTFLLWLLIAALPIQGIAAVAKASCGPAHHASLPAAVIAEAHHHDGESFDEHHHHGYAGANDGHHIGAASAMADVSKHADHTHKSSFCSACAACCFGAVAPPPTVAWDPVLTSSVTVVLPPSIQFTGFIPAGLERPPRQLSA